MPAQNNQTTILLAWSKLVPVSEGQDPLGLNLRVSARLSGQLLHCITSITPRARYFSFFPWCVDQINRRRDASDQATLREAVRLLEKSFTFGCVLHHDERACEGGGLVGSLGAIRWLRANRNATPQFSKLTFSKNPALDAYFNSLVHLGFFVADADQPEDVEKEEMPEVSVSELELTPLGGRVANAYAAAIAKLSAPLTISKQPDNCDRRELAKWGAVGGLCELRDAKAPDRQILREVFFNHVGSPGASHIFRQHSLVLLLELVHQLEAHDVDFGEDAFNDAVYFDHVWQEDAEHLIEIEWPAALKDIVARWRMFHFHFYLSIALESLFVAVVSKARSAGLKGFRLGILVEELNSKAVHKLLESQLSTKFAKNFLDATPREILALVDVEISNADHAGSATLNRLISRNHPLSERNLMTLFDDVGHDTPEGIASAMLLLVIATTRFIHLERMQHGGWLAQAVRDTYKDVTTPVVLRELRERFPDYWNVSWREIANFVIRRFVVRQHETLAYDKNWNGSRAFFHTENDLIRWRQLNYDEIGVGNARFTRALRILRDLALVDSHDEGRTLELTQDGRVWLKKELAALSVNEAA